MSRHTIGVFGDLHCNLDALSAMLELEPQVKTWICLGDFVGLFPQINETIDLIREIDAICILGDHEIALLNGQNLPQSSAASESLDHQRDVISKTNHDFLKSLQAKRFLTLGDIEVMLVHDLNENSGEKYFFDYEGISSRIGSEVQQVFFANTHLPTMHLGKFHRFFNPGSLGFPIQQDPKPSYLLFNDLLEEPHFKELITAQSRVKHALVNSRYNPKYMQYLENGYQWPKK